MQLVNIIAQILYTPGIGIYAYFLYLVWEISALFITWCNVWSLNHYSIVIFVLFATAILLIVQKGNVEANNSHKICLEWLKL